MRLATKQRTIADVRAARPTTIYYGALTCWWSDAAPPYRTKGEYGLPCDPRGGVLLQTEDVEAFLRSAEENPEFYGRHGLRAFEAALHGNVLASNGNPTCFNSWDEYNSLLDAEQAAGQETGHALPD